jgi:hypothetical protein
MCAYRHAFSLKTLYTVGCLSKYAHKKSVLSNKATEQLEANVKVHIVNAGLLAQNQFASRRSWDCQT